MRKTIAILAGVALLAAANHGIYGREQILREGRVILLQLAPVDPRSLMQGDYMALRFAVADEVWRNRSPELRDGRIVLKMDARGVGSFARFDRGGPLAPDEAYLRYRLRHEQPKFATNAFFFQEGHADRYTAARFGEFRVADDGAAILTGLRDADLKPLGGATPG